MTERDAKKYDDEQVWRILLADVEKYRPIDIKDAERQVAEAKERIRLGVHSDYPGIQYLTLAKALALANRREEAIEAYRTSMRYSPPDLEEDAEALFMDHLRSALEVAKELQPPFSMRPEPVTSPKSGVLISPFHLKWIVRKIERLRVEVERLEEQLRLAKRG